jgi:hypothetical protein
MIRIDRQDVSGIAALAEVSHQSVADTAFSVACPDDGY